jgi:hypothetical protein
MGTRCFFDSNTDNQVTESYTNVSSVSAVVNSSDMYIK